MMSTLSERIESIMAEAVGKAEAACEDVGGEFEWFETEWNGVYCFTDPDTGELWNVVVDCQQDDS